MHTLPHIRKRFPRKLRFIDFLQQIRFLQKIQQLQHLGVCRSHLGAWLAQNDVRAPEARFFVFFRQSSRTNISRMKDVHYGHPSSAHLYEKGSLRLIELEASNL